MIGKFKKFLRRKREGSQPSRGIIPKAWMKKFLPKDPVVVEAGASLGHDTVEMGRLWPEGMIYAFEPIPEIFGKLVEKTRSLGNVRCFPFALSDQCRRTEMFVSSDEFHQSSSLLKPKIHLTEHPHIGFPSRVEVETVTLDAWAEKNKVPEIDFLWLDLQGAEGKVIAASPAMIKTVRAIYTEVSLKELYEEGVLYAPLRARLADSGFYVRREELAWQDAGNVLFVKRRKFW